MYNSGYFAGQTSPPVHNINNPFVNDSSNAATRFPDISASSQPDQTQYSSWQPTYNPAPQQYQQQSPQITGYPQQQGGGYPSSPQPFQPSSSFGQQLSAQVNGSSYGYLQGQPTGISQQSNTYNPAQQQLQNNPGYIPQLDPYASIGQLWNEPQQQQQQNQNQNQFNQPQTTSQFSTTSANSTSRSATGELHPREHIRAHKAEIESWDNYAWKQLLNSFEALKSAWEGRKAELAAKVNQMQMQMQYAGGQYQLQVQQIQQEAFRLQGLLKEADLNFDSVAASTFQMQEVFSGYRQSGDLASKRRVREATNAALHSLPDWPQPY